MSLAVDSSAAVHRVALVTRETDVSAEINMLIFALDSRAVVMLPAELSIKMNLNAIVHPNIPMEIRIMNVSVELILSKDYQ